MRSARAALAAVAVMLWAAATVGAFAQGGTAQAFLEGIYKPYLTKESKGTSLASDAEIRRYFASPLADAIIEDFNAAAKRQDLPLLNGDPFIDAQDWEISDLRIDVKPAGAKWATGTVRFTNMKEREMVALDLVQTPDGWRIGEIRSRSGSLRALYKLK
jgi:hypothetical protein